VFGQEIFARHQRFWRLMPSMEIADFLGLKRIAFGGRGFFPVD
jgi:hypothetical protein